MEKKEITVAEFIKQLQQYPQDAIVEHTDWDTFDDKSWPAEITYNKYTKKIYV